MPSSLSGTSGKLAQIINSIQLFRQHTGMISHLFRNQSLMDKACQLSLDTDINISKVVKTIKIDDAL